MLLSPRNLQLALVVMNSMVEDLRLSATWPTRAELGRLPLLWPAEDKALLEGTMAGWLVQRLHAEAADSFSTGVNAL